MDTSPRSAAFSPFADVVGPFASYDELERTLGPDHPWSCSCDETLFYYDQPQVYIGRVAGDSRPMLSVLMDTTHTGEDPDRTFHTRIHHFVFTDERVMKSTLHYGCAPTRRTYELADEIYQTDTESSQIGSRTQRHSCATRILTAESAGEYGYDPKHEPDGTKIGTEEKA